MVGSVSIVASRWSLALGGVAALESRTRARLVRVGCGFHGDRGLTGV